LGHSVSAQAFGGQKISCGKTDAVIGSSIRPPEKPAMPARVRASDPPLWFLTFKLRELNAPHNRRELISLFSAQSKAHGQRHD
jgi:hypothetical protein